MRISPDSYFCTAWNDTSIGCGSLSLRGTTTLDLPCCLHSTRGCCVGPNRYPVRDSPAGKSPHGYLPQNTHILPGLCRTYGGATRRAARHINSSAPPVTIVGRDRRPVRWQSPILLGVRRVWRKVRSSGATVRRAVPQAVRQPAQSAASVCCAARISATNGLP